MNLVLKTLSILETAARATNNMSLAELEDIILDAIEEKILKTDNKIDDALIMPVLKFIRITANVPDDLSELRKEKNNEA